jgi:cobalamin biosynthesis protein CobW
MGTYLKGCGDETCSEDDIMELSNGCICCTVADDFIPTLTKLLEREVKPDHIVIETSGLALTPTTYYERSIGQRYLLRLQLTV